MRKVRILAAGWPMLAVSLLQVAAAKPSGDDERFADLKRLSLTELIDLEVTTVSRKEERFWSAPSGIDVVTGDDIRRAGVQTLPDALRLAAGVHVGQSSAKSWAVSLRGMNVLAANKIAVSMDGRSLLTPFFSGVLWDAQDTLLEDIDRIEVVRGPVGALWGAFAVNGFVQILTKPAWATQGWLASVATGNQDPISLGFRYGGTIGPDTFYRVYAKYYETEWTYTPSGQRLFPSVDFLQTGFRVDGRRAQGVTFTLQGDFYTNRDLRREQAHAETSGANLLGRWRRTFATDANVETEVYWDRTYRLIPGGFEETRNTAVASGKYRFGHGRHDLLIGADGQFSWDKIGEKGLARLEPRSRTIHNVGVYVQDSIQLVPARWAATLAVKGEHNTFSGFDYQPSVRLAWTPTRQTTLWAAVSRAIRTPVRVDEDLVLELNGTKFFEADDRFSTENAIAWELGWRHQPAESLTLDVSAFAYRYDDLRSTEPAGASLLPQTFRNLLNAESVGAEVTVMYQPLPRLFVKASYRYLDLEFWRDASSHDTSNGSSEGNDPEHLLTLAVHLDLPGSLELNGYLRHASALPNPRLPGYTTVDVRLGWHVSNRLELSLTGRNLLDSQHAEFVTTNSLNEEVHRSVLLKATWRY